MKIISKLFLVILLSGFQAFHASGANVGIEDSETLILQTSDKKSAMDELLNVLLLRSYNTRLVILSTTTLGTAAGIVGAFLLLRKRSLMGDALAHSTLPGIAIAFIIMVSFGGSGKSLAGLIAGATLTGVLGLLIMLAIRNTTRLRDDVAMGMVLSVSFGVGLAILGVIQNMPQASAAGLESFIYGKTASMVMADFMTIMVVALVCSLAAILMFKELALLCFDDRFAVAEGFPALRLDILLLVLVTTVTVIGLQSVGLILIIAFLITPPSAARFWTEKLPTMTFLSAVIGAISGWLGASISALVPKMPAGAVIVVVASSIFLFSMLSAPKRGVVARWIRYKDLKKKVERQHVLRAAFELVEEQKNGDSIVSNYPFPLQKLLAKRTWKAPKLNRILNHEQSIGHLERRADGMLQLSESGFGEAARITRNHRLWEIYLVTHADIAPSHVDRDADMVEHILEADMVHRLEEELRNSGAWIPSPHELSTRTQAS